MSLVSGTGEWGEKVNKNRGKKKPTSGNALARSQVTYSKRALRRSKLAMRRGFCARKGWEKSKTIKTNAGVNGKTSAYFHRSACYLLCRRSSPGRILSPASPPCKLQLLRFLRVYCFRHRAGSLFFRNCAPIHSAVFQPAV